VVAYLGWCTCTVWWLWYLSSTCTYTGGVEAWRAVCTWRRLNYQ